MLDLAITRHKTFDHSRGSLGNLIAVAKHLYKTGVTGVMAPKVQRPAKQEAWRGPIRSHPKGKTWGKVLPLRVCICAFGCLYWGTPLSPKKGRRFSPWCAFKNTKQGHKKNTPIWKTNRTQSISTRSESISTRSESSPRIAPDQLAKVALEPRGRLKKPTAWRSGLLRDTRYRRRG